MNCKTVVKFDKKRKAIVNEGCKLKGLTKVLKSTFYPAYVYTPNPKKLDLAVTSKCKRIKGSLRVGTGFDTKISETVRLQQLYNLDPKCFWNAASATLQQKKIKLVSHQKTVMSICKRRNPYVQRFWQLMRLYKWKPVETQVPVRHSTLQLGTMIDVVCKDAQGKYKCLELKTGFEDYYKVSSGAQLSKPYHDKNDCPRNQHQLQLAASEDMYRQTHKDKAMGQSLLLRFHSSGVEIVPVEDWCTSRVESLFVAIRNHLASQIKPAKR